MSVMAIKYKSRNLESGILKGVSTTVSPNLIVH